MPTCFRVAAAALCLLSRTAIAADLPSRLAPPPTYEAPFSWTGILVGVHAGYSFGRDQTGEYATQTGGLIASYRYGMNSPLIGVNLGANYQIGAVVLGAEGDVDVLSASGGNDNSGGKIRAHRDWEASLRGRLGYAFGPALVYATGGAAFTQAAYNYYNPLNNQSEGPRVNRMGYTVGGGVDYAFTDHISARLEYRYTDFGLSRYVGMSAFLGATGTQNSTAQALRAGVNYRF